MEELLERGGADQFSITVFGDEPYGNYNRIMLSHVLSGEETEEGIFLNSLPWYAENGIDLRAGVRVERIDRFAKVVHDAGGGRTPYDVLLLATGSTPFFPSMEGLHRPDGSVLDGVFGFRTLDDARSLLAAARTHRAPSSSAAVCSAWRPRTGWRPTACRSTSSTPRRT